MDRFATILGQMLDFQIEKKIETIDRFAAIKGQKTTETTDRFAMIQVQKSFETMVRSPN